MANNCYERLHILHLLLLILLLKYDSWSTYSFLVLIQRHASPENAFVTTRVYTINSVVK